MIYRKTKGLRHIRLFPVLILLFFPLFLPSVGLLIAGPSPLGRLQAWLRAYAAVLLAQQDQTSGVTLDLRITPTVELSRIFQIAGLKDIAAKGTLSGTVRIRGKLDDLNVTGEMRGDDVTLDGYTRTKLNMEFRARWLRAAGRVLVRSFEIRSPSGDLRGSGDFYMDSKTAASSLNVTLRNFDLLPLTKLLNDSVALASRASGKMALQWKGSYSPSSLSGNGQLHLAASRKSPAEGILPLSGQADVRIRPGSNLVRLSSANALGARLDGRIALPSSNVIQAEVEGSIANMDVFTAQLSQFLGKKELLPIEVSGPARFRATATGKRQQLEAVIAFKSPGMNIGELKNVGVGADGRIGRSRLEFSAVLVPEIDAAISARGSIGLTGKNPPVDVDLRTDRVSLQSVLRLLGSRAPADGVLQASMHLGGTTQKLQGSGSIQGENLKLYQEPMGRFDAAFQISGNEIRTTRFRLTKDPGRPDTGHLDAQAAYNLDSHRFSFQSTGNDLRFEQLVLPWNTPFRGTVSFAASGSGTKDNPAVNAQLSVADADVRGRYVGPLTVNAAVKDELLNLDASLPDFNFTAAARLRTQEPYPADFRAIASRFDLGLLNFIGPGGRPLTGTADLSLTGSGNLRNPLQSDVSVSVRNLAGRLGEMDIAARGPVQAAYRDGLVEIAPEAVITVGESSLRVAGTIPIRRDAPAGDLRARARLNLSEFSGIAGTPQRIAVSGDATLDAAIFGPAAARNITGVITVANGSFQHPNMPAPITDVSVQAVIRDRSIIVQLAQAVWNSGRINLTGELPVSLLAQRLPFGFLREPGQEPATFDLQLTELPLQSLVKVPDKISGLVSLRATGTAAGFDPESITAEITFEALRLNLDQAEIQQSGGSLIVFRNGTLSIRELMLTGPETQLRVSGFAAFTRGSRLDLRLQGTTDAAILGFLTEDLRVAGPMQVQVAVSGTLNAPRLSGSVEVKDGQASLHDPSLSLENLDALFAFTGNQIDIRRFNGTLNGGSMRAGGTIDLAAGTLRNFNLTANLRDVFLEFPEGLRSFLNANLTVTSSDDSIVIGGKARALESSYREPVEIGGEILKFFETGGEAETGRERSALLRRVLFNVAIETVTPLIVKNNLAELEANAALRLVGSYYAPSIVGSVNLEEGGQIFLNERTYYIRRGAITFNNQTRIEPDLNIQAETSVGQWDITMLITGTPERLTTQLSSEPTLSQPDIVSVLLTGHPTAQLSGREFQLAQAQALSLIAGQAGQELARGAQELIGITTFRLEPSFIAAETTDPGARLTLGQDITRDFSLGYSMNLVDAGDQLWIAEYDVTRRFTTQAIKQEDNSYRTGFSHELQFGGPAQRPRRRARRPEIGAVTFQAGPLFPEKVLRDRFDQDTGDRYEFPDIQDGLDRLRESYVDRDRLEAKIRLDRQRRAGMVNLNVRIDEGPEVELVFTGAAVPDKLVERVRQIWEEGVFDTARLNESVQAIRTYFIEEGYLQVNVTHETEEQPGKKTVRFQVTPGPRYSEVSLEFPGASEIDAADLENSLREAGLYVSIFVEPREVVEYLQEYYRRRGYLDVEVLSPEQRLDEKTGTAIIRIPVHEGPLFTIGDLNFEGNRAFDYDRLWILIPISSGSIYRPEAVQESEDILERFYRNLGYNEVGITYRVDRVSETSRANVTFQIDENRQSVISEIAVEGNQLTSDSLVRRSLTFDVGDVLDFSKIGNARRKLYETGIYTFVDFETQDLSGRDDASEKPVRVRVVLRELSMYRLDYGGYYDNERGPGGIADIVRRSPFGTAAALGLRLRYDSDLRLARLYYAQPHIKDVRLKTDFSAIIQRESTATFSARRIGASVIQQKELPKQFLFDYGYRYDHVRWNGIPEDPTLFIAEVPVARIMGTIWRDTRDSILDATRGEFMSNSLEYGPTWLGSEIGFYRYFGQYFRYFALDRYLLKPDQDEKRKPERPRFVYAAAIRLGLTQGFGQDIISPDRFYAGGGTTMRGFEQDLLGPTETVIDPDTGQPEERPLGGEALFLLNNEIRFPIYSIFGGVGFVDIGNVYPTISDFSLSDLRKSAGLGLRVRIRFLLLRFDYGFKLDRRPGESAGEFFFSIGQAF